LRSKGGEQIAHQVREERGKAPLIQKERDSGKGPLFLRSISALPEGREMPRGNTKVGKEKGK